MTTQSFDPVLVTTRGAGSAPAQAVWHCATVVDSHSLRRRPKRGYKIGTWGVGECERVVYGLWQCGFLDKAGSSCLPPCLFLPLDYDY
jgi:hypothetical protein